LLDPSKWRKTNRNPSGKWRSLNRNHWRNETETPGAIWSEVSKPNKNTRNIILVVEFSFLIKTVLLVIILFLIVKVEYKDIRAFSTFKDNFVSKTDE
ncbi:hypothetical protein DHD32_17980, partial [Arenibacter sp. TNZ]|uniref:hypothetical protein n=1 Tax=Arenibacter TaxID=178469 RepID=UPI0019640A83